MVFQPGQSIVHDAKIMHSVQVICRRSVVAEFVDHGHSLLFMAHRARNCSMAGHVGKIVLACQSTCRARDCPCPVGILWLARRADGLQLGRGQGPVQSGLFRGLVWLASRRAHKGLQWGRRSGSCRPGYSEQEMWSGSIAEQEMLAHRAERGQYCVQSKRLLARRARNALREVCVGSVSGSGAEQE